MLNFLCRYLKDHSWPRSSQIWRLQPDKCLVTEKTCLALKEIRTGPDTESGKVVKESTLS